MAFDSIEKPGLWARYRVYFIAVALVAAGGWFWQRSTRPLPVAVVESLEQASRGLQAITLTTPARQLAGPTQETP